eukprot:scaffold2176_cov350-Prasinococcus_capsulatus_cf.AAC.4
MRPGSRQARQQASPARDVGAAAASSTRAGVHAVAVPAVPAGDCVGQGPAGLPLRGAPQGAGGALLPRAAAGPLEPGAPRGKRARVACFASRATAAARAQSCDGGGCCLQDGELVSQEDCHPVTAHVERGYVCMFGRGPAE